MNNKKYYLVASVTIVLYALLQAILGISENIIINDLIPIIITVLMVGFIFLHGSLRFGIKNMLVFFIITTFISWSYESISILTGFPFGDYHYTDKLGLKLLLVPIVIMPAYFGSGYLSWTIAQLIIGDYNSKPNKKNWFVIPFIAAFIMVIWDFTMDPFMSTISGNWIWENGGAYFGVPLVNFLGWFICVFTIYIVYSLYLQRNKEYKSHDITKEKPYWITAVIMYALLPVFTFFKMFFASNETIKSLDGNEWSTIDIYTTQALMGIFMMWFISLLTIIIVKNYKINH